VNEAKVAAALNTISLAFGELAEALTQNGVAPVSAAPGAIPALADDDFPPFEPTEYEAIPLPAETTGLGKCPFHNTPWTVKAAGVSKAGKAYNSFYKCDGKNPDGSYCARKPVKAWADAHPIAA